MKLLRYLAVTAALGPGVMAQDEPINTPSPILEPSYPACAQFHLAAVGDNCYSISTAAGISGDEFYRINPAIGGEAGCQTQIFAGTWYCVRSMNYNSNHVSYSDAIPGTYATEEIPGPTEEPEVGTTTTIAEEPEITQGPPAAEYCNFGDCWYEFGQLSFGDPEILQSATDLCTSLFNLKCQDVNTLGFPEKVVKGCKDCADFSSACPCWTEKKYHTNTRNRILYDCPANHKFKPWGGY